MKKNRTWKVLGYSFLGLAIAGAAFLGFEYNQLQPKNHFKTIPVVSSGPTSNTNTTQNNWNNPTFNILIMGSDERPSQDIGHSDSMILAHVDLNKNTINAVSIPRDTRVYLDGYGYTKLTSVQFILQANKGKNQGIVDAVKAISNLTGVPINYYVETNFSGLQAMVNALGGIHMKVPQKVQLWHKWVQPGNYYFDGNAVLALVRERHSLSDGDYGRQQLQLEALKGLGKEALSPANLPKLPSFIDSISKYLIATNMSTSDMVSLGLAEKNFNPNKQLHYQQIPGTAQNLYDDVLKANNDEIVINQQEMKSLIARDFS